MTPCCTWAIFATLEDQRATPPLRFHLVQTDCGKFFAAVLPQKTREFCPNCDLPIVWEPHLKPEAPAG